jgi:ubiquinone/menaquinone biosynthesis C-methylase UbiE
MAGQHQHQDVVQREFARQAETFEGEDSFFANVLLAEWIIGNLAPLESDLTVLEVACGAAHLGEHLAARVRQVVGVDLTPEMLATGRARLVERGIRNVLLQRGDATDLPFVSGSFDLVVCRFAVHHFDRPADAIAEMARVCRPGGRVAIVDMVADPDRNDAFNDIERRRDPSHTRALTVDELHSLLVDAGTRVVHTTDHDQVIPVDRWLTQARTPDPVADQIRAEVRAELDGGPPTGLRATTEDEDLAFVHAWHLVVAARG